MGGDGILRSVTTKESVDTFPLRDANGVTVQLVPGKTKTTEITVEFYGDAVLSSVSAGAFSEGTIKMVSAKISQSNEGVPEGTHTYKSYDGI